MHSSHGAARNAQVALKTPRPELHDRARASARITHEYEHTRALSHPNIVRVFDLCADEQPSFMTMELIEGELLSTALRDRDIACSASLAYRILQGCGQALAHAHRRNIVHGDFKPGNVFITRDKTVKVIDFGAAATPASAESRIAAGTPAYASPEVLSGATPEARDDVFSFACVAYELLTAQHPFDRTSSLQAREEGRTPPRVWSLSASQWLALLSALSWRREERPGDIASLVAALAPEPQPNPRRESRAAHHDGSSAHELPDDIMPPQRSWGFFVFIACALAVTYLATQREGDGNAPDDPLAAVSIPQTSERPMATAGAMAAVASRGSSGGAPPSRSPLVRTDSIQIESSRATPSGATAGSGASPSTTKASAAGSARQPAKAPAAATSAISFEADNIVTSEGSVAAVFLIRRSQPLGNRVRAEWKAIDGSAKAGIDFAPNAAGSVEFADGQAQRAIYVPLRNDIHKEDDETFTVVLRALKGARLGEISTAEATIRDDD